MSMEDFQSNWTFEADKISNGFLAPSTSLQGSRTFHKDRLFENFESPILRSGQGMTPNLTMLTRTSFLPLDKEGDFVLDSAEGIKTEHQEQNIQYYPTQIPQTQYDNMFEAHHHHLKMPEYDVENYQISRSRGPSFNFSKERRGSEDFFSAGLDFMRLFRNYGDQFAQEIDAQHQITTKAEFDPYHGQEDNVPNMYNFQHLQPAKDIHFKEHKEPHGKHEHSPPGETSEEMAAEESTLQLSMQGSDGENSLENPLSSGSNVEGESEPTPKKKRKGNNHKAITEESTQKNHLKISKMPKLKKSKSENKSAMYSITPKGNSLSLKIVKLPESKEADASSKLKVKKQTSKINKGVESPLSENVKVEELQASLQEKPLEMPPSVGNSQSDLAPSLMRSKSSNLLSTIFQGKAPGSIRDLVAGLGFPAEVEEMLNNSKIFNNIQSSMTRKIGPLTVEERRIKVEKYFEKRKNRTWSKRINYDCRKRVADSRLRFKGRFVTKTQAFSMLAEEGIYPDPNKITESEIKELLEEKFGSVPEKKKENQEDGRKNNGRPKRKLKWSENNKTGKDTEQGKIKVEDDDKSSVGSYDEDF